MKILSTAFFWLLLTGFAFAQDTNYLRKIPQQQQPEKKYKYSTEPPYKDTYYDHSKCYYLKDKYEESKRKYERIGDKDYRELMILYLEEYNDCKRGRR